MSVSHVGVVPAPRPLPSLSLFLCAKLDEATMACEGVDIRSLFAAMWKCAVHRDEVCACVCVRAVWEFTILWMHWWVTHG